MFDSASVIAFLAGNGASPLPEKSEFENLLAIVDDLALSIGDASVEAEANLLADVFEFVFEGGELAKVHEQFGAKKLRKATLTLLGHVASHVRFV